MASTPTITELLTVDPGRTVDLSGIDPRSTPGFDGGKSDGRAALAQTADRLAELQERLYAEARHGGERSVLLVLQGMDTAGKGGVVRHVVGRIGAQGAVVSTFGAPTEEELAHDFLWRVRPELPAPGMVGVFDRSHYEDVLVARVRRLVPQATWEARYAAINEFEAEVAAAGTTVLKVFLHISHAEQGERLAERLARPEKHWKYDPSDVDDRVLWDDYATAYADAISRCSTPEAPWFVVPADRKWYARWAVGALLEEALRGLDPRWPEASFDVDAEHARLGETSSA